MSWVYVVGTFVGLIAAGLLIWYLDKKAKAQGEAKAEDFVKNGSAVNAAELIEKIKYGKRKK